MHTITGTLFPPTAAESPKASPASGLHVVDQLLRDRAAFLHHIQNTTDLLPTSRALLITIAVCSAVFGATLGFHRGGLQILYAAIKMPLAVLLTAGISTPALTAMRSAVDVRGSAQRDAALVLGALALGTLIVAALAPVILLADAMGAGYHRVILVTVTSCGVGGMAGVALLARGIHATVPTARRLVAFTLLSVFALVGTQMSWSLRPWLLRPKAQHIPFMRAYEGSFADSVQTSIQSAQGIYVDDVDGR
ncbi:MAG: hypothetical protein AB2A00_22480 [Myxococcota bacterium]